jgi:hypothetical protein
MLPMELYTRQMVDPPPFVQTAQTESPKFVAANDPLTPTMVEEELKVIC